MNLCKIGIKNVLLTFFDKNHTMNRMQTTLINEVPVIFFERKDAPLYIRVIFQAGARYDEKEGTAHFLEHMLASGSAKFSTKDLLAEYIENVGGQFDLFTNHDTITLNAQVADSSDLQIAIDILDQMINHSLFSPESLEKERGSIFSEQANRKSNQKEFVVSVYQKLFFQNTSLEKSILGTKESLSSISLEDLLKFKEKNITKNRMSVIVAGDIEIEILKKELEKILPKERGEEISLEKPLPIIKDKLVDLENYPSKQASLIIGFRTRNFTLKDKVCGDICAAYLGGGRASLLIKELRYKKGLVYDIFAYNINHPDRGTFTIRTNCESDNFSNVLKKIKEEVEKFIQEGITEEKFSFIKSKIEKTFKIKLQTSKSWVEQNEKFLVSDYILKLNQITTEDIREYLVKNLNPEEMYIAVCGPESLKESLD